MDEFVRKYPPAAKNAAIAEIDPTVASRTKKRNKIAAANAPILSDSSASSDNDDEPSLASKRRKTATTEQSKKKKQKMTAAAKVNEEEVEDLSGLSKSAASRKTVKILKAYIQSKGLSIKDVDGKPFLKAGLIEVLMSMSS